MPPTYNHAPPTFAMNSARAASRYLQPTGSPRTTSRSEHACLFLSVDRPTATCRMRGCLQTIPRMVLAFCKRCSPGPCQASAGNIPLNRGRRLLPPRTRVPLPGILGRDFPFSAERVKHAANWPDACVDPFEFLSRCTLGDFCWPAEEKGRARTQAEPDSHARKPRPRKRVCTEFSSSRLS